MKATGRSRLLQREGRKTEIADSSGHVDLDHAALEAVDHWRFEPYRSEEPGRTVWVQVPVVFAPNSGR